VTGRIDFAHVEKLLQLDFVGNQREDYSVGGINVLDV
jgi:hypothetical protein